MENKSKKTNNLKEEIRKNINIPLKTRKKPKGCSRFLRNIIKGKARMMKEVMKNRFYKWRKDALKGKIKKTVMIRISVSKEKEPKPRYQIGKANPKEQSKSVSKDNFKSFNTNNPPQNICNIRVQNVENIEKEDNNRKNRNKNVNQNQNQNPNIPTNKDNEKNKVNDKSKVYKKVNPRNKNEVQPNKDSKNTKQTPYTKNNNYDKNKINTKNEIPKSTPRSNKINQANNSNIPKTNKNLPKNNQQNLNKTPISNISNPNVTNPSTTKKDNPNDKKVSRNNNYNRQSNQNEAKDKIPKSVNKKYEPHQNYTSLPAKTVKVDLTKEKYNNNTVNRKNRNDNLSGNRSYDRTIPNKNIYNNNTYQKKKIENNNNDNKLNTNYRIKPDSYNNDSSSLYSNPKIKSDAKGEPIYDEEKIKAGVTTVIQHYSGRRNRYLDYSLNTSDINQNKK